MLQIQKKWKQLLSRYKIDRPWLFPHSIVYFQVLVDTLNQKFTNLLYKHPEDTIQYAFEQLLKELDDSVDEMTVGCVVKKMALMHAILNKSQSKQFVQIITSTVHKQIKVILKEDVATTTKVEPSRREDSIAKIKDFMRKLSVSKQRSQSKGKMGIERQKEKGAVAQIIQKQRVHCACI